MGDLQATAVLEDDASRHNRWGHLAPQPYKPAGSFSREWLRVNQASPDEMGQYQFSIRKWISDLGLRAQWPNTTVLQHLHCGEITEGIHLFWSFLNIDCPQRLSLSFKGPVYKNFWGRSVFKAAQTACLIFRALSYKYIYIDGGNTIHTFIVVQVHTFITVLLLFF